MLPNYLQDAFFRIDFDRDLVFRFFIEFSIFENALKATQFRDVKQNGSIEPNWDKFAKNIVGMFDQNKNEIIRSAVEYFAQNPVMGQFLRGNALEFEQVNYGNITQEEILSLQIRKVRNNLFHGVKFAYTRPRDTELLQYSLVILEDWATIQNDVREIIERLN